MARFWLEEMPATNALGVFNFKTLLKAHGYTVPASSDGTTYNASGDQITTGAAGAGGMDNNGAWFRLRSANGLVEFTVQRGTGGSPSNYRIKVARAPFTAGSPAATVTPQTANPTLDEVILLGGGTDAAPSFSTLIGAVGTTRIKAMVDDANGDFYYAGMPTGGGNANTAWLLTGFEQGDPGDHWPYMAYAAASSQWTSGMSSATGTCRSWTPASGGLPVTIVPQLIAAAGATVFPSGTAVDPITGAHPISKVPVARAAGDGGGICWKGFSTLLRWIGVTADTTGDTYTLDAANDWIIMRQVALPWDGSTPTNGVASNNFAASELAPLDLGYDRVTVGSSSSTSYKMYGLKDPGPGEKTWVVPGRADFDGEEAGEALQVGSIGVDSVLRG
jgi:hypothetical protein